MKSIPETPCSGCGELVPENCVRCRQCGSFLRPDIERHYAKLSQTVRPVIYSQPRKRPRRDEPSR
jgi:hypothetical protein